MVPLHVATPFYSGESYLSSRSLLYLKNDYDPYEALIYSPNSNPGPISIITWDIDTRPQ